jgi:D-serine dehydratase
MMTHASNELPPMPGDVLLDSRLKGFPAHAPSTWRSRIGERQWNVLNGDLPFPLAVLSQSALTHNLDWMHQFASSRDLSFAPHGKTSMSPELFARQRAAGIWGMTVATLHQLGVAVRSGERRLIIANQLVSSADFDGLSHWLHHTPDLSVWFLVDSLAQVDLIEAWADKRRAQGPKFQVLLEVGIEGKRTGTRDHAQAMLLAKRIAASNVVALHGIECYEGGLATCNHTHDREGTDALMQRVCALMVDCAAEQLFAAGEVLLTAGGTALFDLVADRLHPALPADLGARMRPVLRSGCYIAHDHGFYNRLLRCVGERIRLDVTLVPALEVWAMVQSCPEPGLALLTAGRRDISYDIELPMPVRRAHVGDTAPRAVPDDWRVTSLNDHHTYLTHDPAGPAPAPVPGELVALGISHPCTTFDKWQWMPIVSDDYRVVDAITTYF